MQPRFDVWKLKRINPATRDSWSRANGKEAELVSQATILASWSKLPNTLSLGAHKKTLGLNVPGVVGAHVWCANTTSSFSIFALGPLRAATRQD